MAFRMIALGYKLAAHFQNLLRDRLTTLTVYKVGLFVCTPEGSGDVWLGAIKQLKQFRLAVFLAINLTTRIKCEKESSRYYFQAATIGFSKKRMNK